MPTSVATRKPPEGDGIQVLLIPLAVLLFAALLTALLYNRFETALHVLAPAGIVLCAAAALAGAYPRRWSRRQSHRRALSHARVERIVDELAAGRVAEDAAEIGRSWRTVDAARALAGLRPPAERARIRGGLHASGAWRSVAGRAARTSRKWDRARALHDLGWLGAPEAAHLVYDALGDNDDDVAWSAVAALGGMEQDLAYHVLLELLDDGRFAPSRIAKVLDTRRHPDPLPLLRARIPDAPAGTLFWIAYLFGRTGAAGALPALRDLAAHADPDVRASAAEALGRIGGEAPGDVLLRMVEDDAWFVRLHACRSLGDLGTARAVEPLRAATADPAWWVRRAAAEALRRIEGDAA